MRLQYGGDSMNLHKGPRVFVSYSHEDKEFVDKLITDLSNASVQIWIDRWEIKIGDSIMEKVASGIQENDYFSYHTLP